MTTTLPTGPTAAADRALAPDLGRGLMLALIALANSALYLYGRPYGPRQHIVETAAPDRLVAFVNTVFVEVRTYPLFAALLGYGVVKAYGRRRVGDDDGDARRALRRRGLLLIGFGAVHALLLFPGDILGLYGVLSLILLTMLRLRDRTLWIIAGGWLVVATAGQALVYSDTGPDANRTFFSSMAIDDPLFATALRPLEWVLSPFGLLTVFSAAIAGMWAARHGVLDHPHRHRALLRRVAATGVGVSVLGGVPMGLLVSHVVTAHSFGFGYAAAAAHVITGVAGGLGYAAAIGLLAARLADRRRPAVTALAACGQRSLSCYLWQSVAFVALFAPYTLGLGASLGSAATAAVALAVWLAGVGLAEVSRRLDRRGPAETLLRRLGRPRS